MVASLFLVGLSSQKVSGEVGKAETSLGDKASSAQGNLPFLMSQSNPVLLTCHTNDEKSPSLIHRVIGPRGC